MKKVRIYLYNYGIKTLIGNFSNNCHDANKCMKMLNDELVKSHGKLPENIFYYMTYQGKRTASIYFIDYTHTGIDKDYMEVIDKAILKVSP